MAFEYYIDAGGGKKLRCGFTTGTCAALAAAGAARRLLTGVWPEKVSLRTPKGLVVEVPLEGCQADEVSACCGVRKDGGDDLDKTAGLLIQARVAYRAAPGITIDGGCGVGRVTKPGLDQPVGAAAINHVPREMIWESVERVRRLTDFTGGLSVTISVPEGENVAKATFNPQLGIMGGISILGTSGIVEPMSMQAMIDTLAVTLRQIAAQGCRQVILTPGNYGVDFLKKTGLDCLKIPVVKCSNFIGEALDAAAGVGFDALLLVGHVGKLVKLAGGMMNTHSRFGDCRAELFCAYAAVCGAGQDLCRQLLNCATTEACLALLEAASLRQAVMDRLLTAIGEQVSRRVGGVYATGVIVFSSTFGELGRTAGTEEVLQRWKENAVSSTVSV